MIIAYLNSHNKAKDASTIEHWFGTYFDSYPIALPDFHFHLSLWHMSYIATRVEWGIVCVTSPIVSFSNHRPYQER